MNSDILLVRFSSGFVREREIVSDYSRTTSLMISFSDKLSPYGLGLSSSFASSATVGFLCTSCRFHLVFTRRDDDD